MKNPIAILLLLALTGQCLAQQLQSATVKAVHDGDSYKLSFTAKPDSVVWIRLYGIDAPEVRYPGVIAFDQPFARAAADSVRQLIKGNSVLVNYKYTDMYDRPVCEVYFLSNSTVLGEPLVDTVSLAEHIVQKGWAWQRPERGNSKGNALLKNIQVYAKEQKLGLWALPGRAIKPETFRNKFRAPKK